MCTRCKREPGLCLWRKGTARNGPAESDGGGGLRPASSGYSPITDQRKPIMMKKPVNRAIRPRPPYGEFAPMWGTS